MTGSGGSDPAETEADVRVLVQRLDPGLPLPGYAHPGDAGADLTTRVDLTLAPGERATVPTGIAVAIPAGYAGFVHPRSGLAARHGVTLVNAPGTVDSGYRGEIQVTVLNTDRARRSCCAGATGSPSSWSRGWAGRPSSRSTACPTPRGERRVRVHRWVRARGGGGRRRTDDHDDDHDDADHDDHAREYRDGGGTVSLLRRRGRAAGESAADNPVGWVDEDARRRMRRGAAASRAPATPVTPITTMPPAAPRRMTPGLRCPTAAVARGMSPKCPAGRATSTSAGSAAGPGRHGAAAGGRRGDRAGHRARPSCSADPRSSSRRSRAPRSEGIWAEIRAEIAAGITRQGGTADEVPGAFGRELLARVPVRTPGRPHRPPAAALHRRRRPALVPARGLPRPGRLRAGGGRPSWRRWSASVVVVRGTEAMAPAGPAAALRPAGRRRAGPPSRSRRGGAPLGPVRARSGDHGDPVTPGEVPTASRLRTLVP